MKWYPIETAPEGVVVDTVVRDQNGERNRQQMKRQGNLWFAGNMYVYYAPTHWRPIW